MKRSKPRRWLRRKHLLDRLKISVRSAALAVDAMETYVTQSERRLAVKDVGASTSETQRAVGTSSDLQAPGLPAALRGAVLRYDDPMRPVADDDWEALSGKGPADAGSDAPISE